MTTEIRGTIIAGTMRAEDLIPAFFDALEQLDPSDAEALRVTYPHWDQDCEAAEYLLESLFDALNEHAPEGCVFGSHPGDGADFGFWEMEEEE